MSFPSLGQLQSPPPPKERHVSRNFRVATGPREESVVDSDATLSGRYTRTAADMSGSGPRGVPPRPPSSPCSSLSFQATLNSPQTTVLAQLQIGSILEVGVGSSGSSVEVRLSGQLAGALTGTKVAQLINCINSGFTFRAVVVTLSGGQCVLRVEAV